jgi:hypothetical protein
MRRGGGQRSNGRGMTGRGELKAAESNKGMQRSADTTALIFGNRLSRPLMPGVRFLLCKRTTAL